MATICILRTLRTISLKWLSRVSARKASSRCNTFSADYTGRTRKFSQRCPERRSESIYYLAKRERDTPRLSRDNPSNAILQLSRDAEMNSTHWQETLIVAVSEEKCRRTLCTTMSSRHRPCIKHSAIPRRDSSRR